MTCRGNDRWPARASCASRVRSARLPPRDWPLARCPPARHRNRRSPDGGGPGARSSGSAGSCCRLYLRAGMGAIAMRAGTGAPAHEAAQARPLGIRLAHQIGEGGDEAGVGILGWPAAIARTAEFVRGLAVFDAELDQRFGMFGYESD